MTLLEQLEKTLPRLIRRIDRDMRKKNLLHHELTRLRMGQPEAVTAARLAAAGIKV